MPLTLAQITDTHLLADPTDGLRGCNPWQRFQAVLQAAIQYQPDGLLLTGDLADQGDLAAYKQLRDAIASLNLPTYWVPGNHDHGDAVQTIFQGPRYYGPQHQGLQSVDLGTWRLLLLNSVLPEAQFGEGNLTPNTLRSLRSELTHHSHQPTAIALHHHPVPTGIDWLDLMQVQNADALLSLLSDFSQVRLVLFGHIHQAFHHPIQTQAGAIAFYGCPSTCLQVTPSTPTPDHHWPGFRLLTLHPSGDYHTEIRRVPSPDPT